MKASSGAIVENVKASSDAIVACHLPGLGVSAFSNFAASGNTHLDLASYDICNSRDNCNMSL